tara:strand:- start:10548 stop:10778 length:231 start_codon:yes stop_codon:yes gene_type:complete
MEPRVIEAGQGADDILERIETNKIFIGDPDNLRITVANLGMRLLVTDLIRDQVKEIEELQTFITVLSNELDKMEGA